MRGTLLRFLAAALLIGSSVDAQALTIAVDVRVIPGISLADERALNTVRLTGPIQAGDAKELRRLLDRIKAAKTPSANDTLATAQLSSRGGDVFEGILIGYLFHEYRVGTLVEKGDICLSACALAFLGGSAQAPSPDEVKPQRTIALGGQVGFHNVALNVGALPHAAVEGQAAAEGFNLALSGSARIIRYATDMGISPAFIARMLGRPTDQFDYVDTAEKFMALQTCLTEPPPIVIARERQAAAICNNSLAWRNSAEASQAHAMSVREARLHLLKHVETNVSTLRPAERLAGQLRAVLASRNEDLIANTYAGLQAAGLPFPELVGSVYHVEGYSAGAYEIECMVSLSFSLPDRYDLVILGPKGLAPPAHVAPRQCRWLFRYDRDDVINPPR